MQRLGITGGFAFHAWLRNPRRGSRV
jgi:hypothetical protein